MRVRLTLVVGILLVALGAATVGAIERRPLPPFQLVAPDGATVVSTQMAVPDQWLLLYVTAGCPSCDRLLAALKEWPSPGLVQRTRIIVGGDAAAAGAYIQQTLPPEVGTIPWYADAGREAWSALRLTGAPVLVGVRNGTIQWAISGVLNDPATLKSVVTTWVGQ
jgi:hypothetical protein